MRTLACWGCAAPVWIADNERPEPRLCDPCIGAIGAIVRPIAAAVTLAAIAQMATDVT